MTLSLTDIFHSRSRAAPRRAPPQWRERTWEVGGLSTVLLIQVWEPLDSLYWHALSHPCVIVGLEPWFYHNSRNLFHIVAVGWLFFLLTLPHIWWFCKVQGVVFVLFFWCRGNSIGILLHMAWFSVIPGHAVTSWHNPNFNI